MNAIIERKVSLKIAENKIDAYFRRNNIAVDIERFGSPLSSTVATMNFTGTTEAPCVGCGKGYEQEARVGAKFEAWEHHQGLICLRKHRALAPFSAVMNQPYMRDFLPLKIISSGQPTTLSIIPFSPPDGYEYRGSLLWPSFLIDYNYVKHRSAGDDADYRSARRYSCGTGFAAGVGYTEAAIHAISEVIERHCVGTFLARVFFHQLPYQLIEIEPDSLPDDLFSTLRDAEACLENEVRVFNISQSGLPTVCIASCPARPLSGVHVFGAGCSIYPSHAAARAIKELVQQHAIEKGVPFVQNEWRRHYRHLEKYPKLLRCLVADIRDKIVTRRALPADPDRISLEGQLSLLITLCDKQDLPVWVKAIEDDPAGISIACAVMPAMERFSIVSLGNYVIPTQSYAE